MKSNTLRRIAALLVAAVATCLAFGAWAHAPDATLGIAAAAHPDALSALLQLPAGLPQTDHWQYLALSGITIGSADLDQLNRAWNAAYSKGIKRAEPLWDKVAMRVPSKTKANIYAWMQDTFTIREWIGERFLQNLAKAGYVVENRDFEGTVRVKKNDIADDQYGIYSTIFEQMGQSVRLFPDKLIFQALKAGNTTPCYDGQYFFDTDHPVGLPGKETNVSNNLGGSDTPWYLLCTSQAMKPMIFQEREPFEMVMMDKPTDQNVFSKKEFLYGVDGRCNVAYGLWQLAIRSAQTFNIDNVKAALTHGGSFKSHNGEPLDLEHTVLAVPPALREAANDLNKLEQISGTTNTLRGRLTVVSSGFLA